MRYPLVLSSKTSGISGNFCKIPALTMDPNWSRSIHCGTNEVFKYGWLETGTPELVHGKENIIYK